MHNGAADDTVRTPRMLVRQPVGVPHLGLALILVLVEIKSIHPQDEPAQLPVLHDTPLPLQPALLQSFLLVQRRAGPREPGQLAQNHALGPRCTHKYTHTHTHNNNKR